MGRDLDRGEVQGEGTSLAKKSYSVEDITAALDDMIEGDQYLDHAQSSKGGGAAAALLSTPSVGTAEEELDALSQALKSFPKKSDDE